MATHQPVSFIPRFFEPDKPNPAEVGKNSLALSCEYPSKFGEMADKADDRGNVYSQLRSWYLAKLRRRLVADAQTGMLTPAHLIRADKLAVEQLIVESATSQVPQAYRHLQTPVVLCLLAPLICAIPAFVVLLDKGIVWAIVLALGPGLLGTVALLFVVRSFLLPVATQMADDLNQAVERENAIADYGLDFVCALNKRGEIVAASPSIERFFGDRLHEIIGKPFMNFIVLDDADRIKRIITASMEKSAKSSNSGGGRSNAQWNFDARTLAKSGKVLDIAWQCEWSETRSMLFCLGRDISLTKQIERIRKEFVTMVGHDLRSPISSVLVTIEVLENEANISAAGRQLLSNAGDSIRRLLKLVQELLDLERVEAGKLPVSRKNEDIVALLSKASDGVKTLGARKNVNIELPAGTIMASVDGDRFVQIVVNLLANAIRFSPEHGVITLAAKHEPDINKVTISVTDMGPGIPPQQQQLIFERFQQGGTEQKLLGSGLGLAICKTLVEAHGGEIGIISQLGHGSTFWFSIPLIPESETVSEDTEPSALI